MSTTKWRPFPRIDHTSSRTEWNKVFKFFRKTERYNMLWLVHTAILSRKWNKESVEKIPFQKSNWNFIDLNRILCKLNLANIWSMKLVFRFVKSAGEIVNGNAHTSFLSFQIRSIAFTKLCRFQRRTHSTVMATWTKQIQEKWSKYKQKTGLMGRGGGGGWEVF